MKISQYDQIWQLWTDYREALHAYVLKMTKDQTLTEDIVQEVFLKTHQSCCSEVEIKNVRSWLFQISYNTLMDFYRKQKDTSPIADQEESVKNDVYEQLSAYLEPLIGFLPEDYAAALKLSDVEGMKQQAVADQLGLSLTATKSRIQRARKMLKEEIQCCFHLHTNNESGLVDFELKDACTSLKSWDSEKK